MKIPSESLNQINDQIISLVRKYNFINNENLELKKEVSRLTAELEDLKSVKQVSPDPFNGKREESIQTIDRCIDMINECMVQVGELKNGPR